MYIYLHAFICKNHTWILWRLFRENEIWDKERFEMQMTVNYTVENVCIKLHYCIACMYCPLSNLSLCFRSRGTVQLPNYTVNWVSIENQHSSPGWLLCNVFLSLFLLSTGLLWVISLSLLIIIIASHFCMSRKWYGYNTGRILQKIGMFT